jgi:hypothetical protein
MSPTKPPTTQTAIRLPSDLLPRLDRIAEKWTKAGPVPVTRSDVLRALLLRAVEAEERRHAR